MFGSKEKTPQASEGEVTPSNGSKTDLETGETGGLHRTLHGRHLQFIAIGGTIGTGLFLGSGKAIATSGPVGTLVAFVFIGSIVYSVMTALCEMATYMPVPGAFTSYASRFIDPTLGFAMGWMYWFSWSITFALELTAAGVIIQYWNDTLSIAIFITVFWAVFTALNFVPIRLFGEVEMWFASIKVVTIVGFILFAVCVNAGVGRQGYLGFTYWVDPGPFNAAIVEGSVGKFIGFWSVLITAGFSYQGAELVGIGAGETKDPEKSVPSAVRWTFWGIFSLFVATIFFVGLLVPSDDPALLLDSQDASASPLVIAANLAGVRVLPDIINAVLLTAVLSAANSNVYSGSRILVSLANERCAPHFMTWTNKFGTPYLAVATTSAVGLLAYMNLSANGGLVFDWLLNVTAVAGFISWSCINICHLRFMAALRAQNIPRATLPYTAPLQPYLSWYGLFFNVLIILTNGFAVFIEWSTSDFFTAYVSVILFVVLLVGHKLFNRSWPLKAIDADVTSGTLRARS
ncbi:Arginine permease [Colletotrichum tanaceti]|uniref:Arginine permease n=1 Tax=Colletotrichum tanaceti TaxID=1306861 RepID=A0A4U6WZU8_9PEZI|nr:Arginine permease [Colletotrichum tanaceti]TKW48274.1 Arginine permease [Colletotrichum tanaceti]